MVACSQLSSLNVTFGIMVSDEVRLAVSLLQNVGEVYHHKKIIKNNP